jgi:hypothetical protein
MKKLRVKVTPEDVQRIQKELGEKSSVLTSSDYSLSEVGDWGKKAKGIFFDGSVFYCSDATVEGEQCSGCGFYVDTEGGCLPGSSLVSVDEFIEEIIKEFPLLKPDETSKAVSEKMERFIEGMVECCEETERCPSDFGLQDPMAEGWCDSVSKAICERCIRTACEQFFKDLGIL